MNTFIILLVLCGLVVIAIKLRNDKKKLEKDVPIKPSGVEMPMCGTYLITKKENSSMQTVVYEDCSGNTTTKSFSNENESVFSITICARRIVHYNGVEVKKLFDYCAK